MAVNIVVGFPRSTTSLTMHICKMLGMYVNGKRWPGLQRVTLGEDETRWVEGMKQMNFFGFYEDPGVLNNICKVIPAEYDDSVTKILATGLCKIKTEVEIEKVKKFNILHLLRSPLGSYSSWEKIKDRHFANMQERGVKPPPPKHPRSTHMLLNWTKFLRWLDGNRWYLEKAVFLDSTLYYTDPKKAIGTIIDTFELSPSRSKIEEVIGLVNPKLQTKKQNWNEEDKNSGELLELCYESLTKRPNDIANTIRRINSYLDEILPEGRL